MGRMETFLLDRSEKVPFLPLWTMQYTVHVPLGLALLAYKSTYAGHLLKEQRTNNKGEQQWTWRIRGTVDDRNGGHERRWIIDMVRTR